MLSHIRTSVQLAISALTRALFDRTGNLAPMPGIFPDYPAPIVRNSPEDCELVPARWGMPSSSKPIFEAAPCAHPGDSESIR